MSVQWLKTTALAVSVLAGPASAAEPVKLWELSGFETPESVLPDPANNIAYVSNVAGKPPERDGNGFISTITLDGKMKDAKWATGMDAPKGLALVGDRLFTADIDKLVEIDTKTGKIVAKHEAPGAGFLNDVAAGKDGAVYVSDMLKNTIWRYAGGKFEPWLESTDLKAPNGLTLDGDRIVVAAWGKGFDGEKTETPGNLVAVDIPTKTAKDLGEGKPVGHLDGIEPVDDGVWLVTDWVAGGLYRIDQTGKAELLLDLNQGSADIGYVPESKTLFMPMMNDNVVVGYRME